MIKSLVIIVLILALAAGSFLSRPNAADFKTFITEKFEQSSNNSLGKFIADREADGYVKSCTINDRGLWVNVQRDGKTVYTGAFNHWWGDGGVLPADMKVPAPKK